MIAWKPPAGVQVIGLANHKPTTRASLHLGKLAPKSIRLDDAPVRGRASNGKSVVAAKAGEQVVSLTVPWEAPREVVKKSEPKKKAAGKSSSKPPIKKTVKETALKNKKGGSAKKPSQGKLDL